ncbi:DUF4012 domain-containing protein [Streptomyces cavernae]|uniref:DUF4012 domain-containing protein n=1 Tax=Streptomyces cavernae TaxID=2259034 RepID=UPI000FEC12FE|nr:DUF4012 domain-containing protein [Streptomyces cavernae]
MGSALLCLAGASWILVTGLLARDELLSAQRELEVLRHMAAGAAGKPAPAAAGKTANGSTAGVRATGPQAAEARTGDAKNADALMTDARTAMRSVAEHTARAHDLTTGPAWYLAAQLPYFGDPIHTVREVAYMTSELTQQMLPPMERVTAEHTGPARQDGLGFLLSALGDAASDVRRAAQVTAAMRERAHGLPPTAWLPTVDQARIRLTRQLDRITPVMSDAALAARVLPSLLGTENPRRYFVVFQNTAEARGTGGMPGAFAVLSVDEGQLRFETFGIDTMMADVSPSVDLGAEYTARYAVMDPTGTWANSNVSPHFPYAARIWAEAWRERSGQRVDGAIAVDPNALARLLRATGPGRLPDGTQLTADNAVDLVELTGYVRYADNVQRKSFLLDVARTAANTLLRALDDPGRLPGLLRATYDVVKEERLKVWSVRNEEQRVLEEHPLSGSLPTGPGPFAGLVVNNAAGGKLDYYLDRELRWTPGRCTPEGRPVTVQVTLTNRAPTSGLPAYITQRGDKPRYPTRPGDNRLLVSYYASMGARLQQVTADGRPMRLGSSFERGHAVYTVDVELPAQQSRTLTFQLMEPVSDRAPVVWRQPLVTPLRTQVEPYPACSG